MCPVAAFLLTILSLSGIAAAQQTSMPRRTRDRSLTDRDLVALARAIGP